MDLPFASPSGPLWPVSVKGVVRTEDQVLLAYNDRDEWELLGGRLEPGEDPEATVVREVVEESGLVVTAGSLLSVWVQPVNPDATKSVLIVAFDCPVVTADEPVASDEHQQVRWWPLTDLPLASLPDGYRRAIDAAVAGGRSIRSQIQ
jgi:ADP-ribose pyrophosphatase YjhB (NUDIX family)